MATWTKNARPVEVNPREPVVGSLATWSPNRLLGRIGLAAHEIARPREEQRPISRLNVALSQHRSHRSMLKRNAHRRERDDRSVPRAAGACHASASPVPAIVGIG